MPVKILFRILVAGWLILGLLVGLAPFARAIKINPYTGANARYFPDGAPSPAPISSSPAPGAYRSATTATPAPRFAGTARG